uniref:Uncharacterized protein n=1 Tax=Amphimedon queenslandica TaxID=400682 RepID=A0A1X7TRY3_AMPQE
MIDFVIIIIGIYSYFSHNENLLVFTIEIFSIL